MSQPRIDLIAEIARVRDENFRLTRENAALRKEVLDANHRHSVERGRCKCCEYHPQSVKDPDHA